MRIHRVRLRNYRGVTDSDVSFLPSGVTIVEGPNEVGKTSLPEALHLAIKHPDSSRNADIRSIRPAGRDEGPEVEITLSSGTYELVYHKRWLKSPQTTLTVSAPQNENLTGREAHDRLKAILDETLDEQLWSALRIEQGTQLTLPLLNLPSLSRSLALAAGGDLATGRDDALWDRIREEYDKYWTATGQPKPDRRASKRAVEEAQSDVDALKRQLDDIEDDIERMSRLVDEERRIETALTDHRKDESELNEQWESTQTLRNECERLTAIYGVAKADRDRAAGEQHRRREFIDTLDNQDKVLAELEAEAEQAAPALVAADRHSKQAEADLNEARSALRSAEDEYRLAHNDRDHLRQLIEVAQLKERREDYLRAAKDLQAAEDHLDSATVDDGLASRIETAHLDYERAKAAAATAAASVETTALQDITVHIDGEEIELVDGEAKRVPVDNEVTVIIPEIATMRVSAGTDSKENTERRNRTQEAYKRLCLEGDVADHTEARTRALQRKEAVRERDEATAQMKRSLRDLTPEVLLRKIEGLSNRVASYPQQRPEGQPLPPDHDTARRLAAESERSVDEHQARTRSCENAAERAKAALQEAQIDEKVLAAKVKDARNNRDDTSRRLAAARDDRADEALTAALVTAEHGVKQAEDALRTVEDELEAADPASLEVLLGNARDATRRASEALQSNRERQRELRVSLDLRGEKGLHTSHEEALKRLGYSMRGHESMEARARAALLLKGTFEKHRQQAHQRYVGPLKEHIERLGKIVFGSTFAVELSDDLRIVRRTLDSTTLDVDQLSTGAREQLGVLSRLACASIVSPDGEGAPVMIDDALGWSDPQRLKTMGAAIAAAGKQCQIIVLTCTPGRYGHVGGTPKVVQL